jgi:uncharacterized protein YecT (DUF1311 family)
LNPPFNILKAKTLNNDAEIFAQARDACSRIQARINDVLSSNSDVRETQRGDFDERSNRGKLANQEIAGLQAAYSQSDEVIQQHIGIFRNAIFYRYALIVYIFSLVGLSYLKIDLNSLPVIAAVISLIGGFIGRSTVKEPLLYKESPQLEAMPSLVVAIVWLIASINYYPLILNKASNNNLISTSEPPQPPAIAATNSNPVPPATTNVQATNNNCLSNGDVITLQGTASPRTLTMSDGTINTVWIITTATPMCVVDADNKADPQYASQKNINDFQIIGLAPPTDTTIELMGTLSTGNVTQYYYVPTAIKVISGRQVSGADPVTSISASSDAAVIQDAISSQTQTTNIAPPQTIAKPASFDCNRAQSTLEKLICADAELSSLDGMVGEAYSQTRKSSPQGSDLRKNVIDEQRQFLKERLEACPIPVKPVLQESETHSIITCLKEKYALRMRELTKRGLCREYRRDANGQQLGGDVGLTCKNNNGDWQVVR